MNIIITIEIKDFKYQFIKLLQILFPSSLPLNVRGGIVLWWLEVVFRSGDKDIKSRIL